MKKLVLIWFIAAYIQGNSQESKHSHNTSQIKPFIGYGIASITQLQNPDLYSYVYSKGNFLGGFSYDVFEKLQYTLYVGFEKSNPVLNGTHVNKDIFVKTTYIGAGVNYLYYRRNNCNFYSGISSLLVKTKKQLPLENGTLFKNAFDITIIGINYKITKRASAAIQIGAGESGFIKALVFF